MEEEHPLKRSKYSNSFPYFINTNIYIVFVFFQSVWSFIGFGCVYNSKYYRCYDGYYAKNITKLPPRKVFDPLADKILVSSAFISFALLGIDFGWWVLSFLGIICYWIKDGYGTKRENDGYLDYR